jgi:hypothetical protein
MTSVTPGGLPGRMIAEPPETGMLANANGAALAEPEGQTIQALRDAVEPVITDRR